MKLIDGLLRLVQNNIGPNKRCNLIPNFLNFPNYYRFKVINGWSDFDIYKVKGQQL